jgi:hypothetical protein
MYPFFPWLLIDENTITKPLKTGRNYVWVGNLLGTRSTVIYRDFEFIIRFFCSRAFHFLAGERQFQGFVGGFEM